MSPLLDSCFCHVLRDAVADEWKLFFVSVVFKTASTRDDWNKSKE